MNFFPIVPINYLNPLAKLSHHHLVLAQWLTNKKYLNFYKKMVERGDMVILDNGCNELEKSIPVEELVEWYFRLSNPGILVVPDYNNTDNLKVTRESLEWLEDWKHISNFSPDLMVVPHSLKDLDEMVKMAVKYIGLNRIMEDYGRVKLIKEYRNCGKVFHLLGMYRNPIKEVDEVRELGDLVLGIDSKLPYRIVSTGRHVHEHRPYPEKMDVFQKGLPEEIVEHCVEEFKLYIHWVEKGEW